MPVSTLIVDDHALFRATARLLLEASGFSVVGEAEDGASAVREADRLHPDLVVLDVQLPDESGFDVTRRLIAREFAGRVVLVSSRSAAEYGGLVDECGATGFIRKDELSGARVAGMLRSGVDDAHHAD